MRYLFVLQATRLLVLLYIPMKYYQNMSKGIEVMAPTRMRLWSDGRHADCYIPHTYLLGDKNGQIKRMISMRMLILLYTIQLVIPNVCTKFQNPRCSTSQEISDRKFCRRKRKNGQIKGMISMRMLILSYMILQVIPNVCTKFQNPRCSSS